MTPQHRQVIVPILEIFKEQKSMRISEVCRRYAKVFGRNFSLRTYGFKGTGSLTARLGIFEHLQFEEVAISREKLLKLTVLPVLKAENFEEEFSKYNGFSFAELRKYFEVDSVEEMLKQDVPRQLGKPIPELTASVPPSMAPPPGRALRSAQSPNAASVVSGNKYRKVLLNDPSPVSYVPRPGCITHVPTLSLNLTSLSPTIGVQAPSPANPAKGITGPPPLLVTASPADLVSTGQAVHNSERCANRGDILPHFPNVQMPFADESYLPSIPSARPDIDVYQPPRQLSAPTFSPQDSSERVKTKVDGYMQNFISLFSSKGKHFPASRAVEEARAKLNEAYRFCRIRISLRDIPSCSKFEARYQRISEFIRAFCWNCPACSLFDLQRSILHLEEVSSFAELQMGPILKHPLIKDFFKPSEAVKEVPEITAYDIHLTVSKFIDSNPKKRKGKLDPEEFMEFFARSQNVASPNELCIRITSFALAFSVEFLSCLVGIIYFGI